MLSKREEIDRIMGPSDRGPGRAIASMPIASANRLGYLQLALQALDQARGPGGWQKVSVVFDSLVDLIKAEFPELLEGQ